MAHVLLSYEGVFVGSSSAMNCVAACKVALSLPEESNVVTMLCDSGYRHLSRFWNREFVSREPYKLRWPGERAGDEGAAALKNVMTLLGVTGPPPQSSAITAFLQAMAEEGGSEDDVPGSGVVHRETPSHP